MMFVITGFTRNLVSRGWNGMAPALPVCGLSSVDAATPREPSLAATATVPKLDAKKFRRFMRYLLTK
jgi:hypothetical protein